MDSLAGGAIDDLLHHGAERLGPSRENLTADVEKAE